MDFGQYILVVLDIHSLLAYVLPLLCKKESASCWNPVLDITSAQRTPKRIRVTAETVTGKEGSSSIGTTDRSLSDEVQQKNISLLNRISTIEKRTTSEYYNQEKQDSQLLNRIV
ncbi:hypothetical protein PSTG_10831 [Puccinia striiformis f. sp. tritici PST-78]|uniref:No apical meristem-associated C-terminal domain-containing protein n=1 Tax=Puccinia striiformis f. sp. tritici PST-78 TaxID=1165861 RepID=A0A0L0V9F8_9BASI|nr:hypothetical protein PSTG_10831 [Puccinia striiformis f. sp. tritici PST-78]